MPGRLEALGVGLALGGVPALVFFGLAATGAMRPVPALAGAGLGFAAAFGFALLLAWDAAQLARNFAATPAKPPLLPPLRALGRTIHERLRAAEQERARLVENAAADRALVERLPDPLFKLDAAGQVIWRNAGATAAFGHEIASLLRHPALRAALAEAARQGTPVRRGIAQPAPVPRDLDITIIPVGGPMFVLINDRTSERSAERMREDFIANASHELRTPLASLIGFIETLRGPAADDPAAQQRFLEIMAEQGARMQRVIADLLSLSRIEVMEHQPPEETLRLAPLLTRIAAGLEPMLRPAASRIELAVPVDLPPVPGDADQLAQVFTNLLDNAIKYGRRGGVIRLVAKTAIDNPRFEPDGVTVAVIDEGPGIPREHIPRLTERFYRVDKGRSRAVGGTGLGLAIVKHVVNRHRGRLLIESEIGRGTTFTVWLPMRR